MSRATPLPRDERRRALIDATQPLLLEHGPGITSRQIAEAANVAEGTIFRVFASKQELIDAAIADLLSPDHLFDRLSAASGSTDLLSLCTGLVGALQTHAREMRRLFSVLQGPAGKTSKHPAPPELARRTIDLITEMLTPHQDALSLPPRSAAGTLMALSFGSSFAHIAGNQTPDPAQVAHTLLYGISKEPEC